VTTGTWVLHLDADLDEVNRHWIELSAAGMVGAAEAGGRAHVYFPARVEGLALTGRWEHLVYRDWHERWRAGLTPVRAGRWTVTPSWLAAGAPHELVIDPGQAFGTGHHETTTLCLEALDATPLEGRTLLDVGTGSGVLAIAAARSGATVTAVDTDTLAVEAATANADRNGVRVTVAHGGVERVAGRAFDVVVANLDSATLATLASRLRDVLAPAGALIASGVGNERSDAVSSALEDVGLDVAATPGVEWTLLRAVRTGPADAAPPRAVGVDQFTHTGRVELFAGFRRTP
jgi:ribosomal protein L11 methyltransferase